MPSTSRSPNPFFDAFQDRAGDPSPISFEASREVAKQLLGFVGIVQFPGLPQHAPDRGLQRFRQAFLNVAGLVAHLLQRDLLSR
jgi:hypothetical protein